MEIKNKEKLDDLSEKYRKYLLCAKFNTDMYYFIHGADIANDFIDKLLINLDKKIIFFRTIPSLLEFTENNGNLLFDKDNFINWINEFKNLYQKRSKNSFLGYVYAYIDLDSLKEIYGKTILTETFRNEFVNFINLATDFSEQIQDEDFSNYLQNVSIRNVWENFYDSEIWKTENITFELLDQSFHDIYKNIYDKFTKNIFIF